MPAQGTIGNFANPASTIEGTCGNSALRPGSVVTRARTLPVSGAGKTTVGTLLAARLGCEFIDGDDWHPPANAAKMAAGTPLTDEDRRPWLERLNSELRAREARGAGAVLACSALKEACRAVLGRGLADCRIVFLDGGYALIRERIERRSHRYMPAALLESQFAALEAPARAIRVDVAQAPGRCVDAALAGLGKQRAPSCRGAPGTWRRRRRCRCPHPGAGGSSGTRSSSRCPGCRRRSPRRGAGRSTRASPRR